VLQNSKESRPDSATLQQTPEEQEKVLNMGEETQQPVLKGSSSSLLPPIYSPVKKKELQDPILKIKNESRNSTKQRLYGPLYHTASQGHLQKSKSPPKQLKRPPIFPVANKTQPQIVTEMTDYVKSPVFKRLHERNTNSHLNYLTASISPLNLRSRSEMMKNNNNSSGGGGSRNGSVILEGPNPAFRLSHIEDGFGHDDLASGSLKKKITTFDQAFKNDFGKLEDKIMRNMKRN
jgi:hypothetical protein